MMKNMIVSFLFCLFLCSPVYSGESSTPTEIFVYEDAVETIQITFPGEPEFVLKEGMVTMRYVVFEEGPLGGYVARFPLDCKELLGFAPSDYDPSIVLDMVLNSFVNLSGFEVLERQVVDDWNWREHPEYRFNMVLSNSKGIKNVHILITEQNFYILTSQNMSREDHQAFSSQFQVLYDR